MPLTEYSQTNGQQMADQPPDQPDPGRYELLPIDQVVASLTNPRQHFDQAKLQDLAESIRTTGLHQPVLVRPLPPARLQETFDARPKGEALPAYEIVSGERRLRASQLAGQATLPAVVRRLSDVQVLEIQIIENLQRDDLSPLEEAEGYERLAQTTGVPKEQIGDRIGKSRSYVYARLKLLDLCTEARQALREGAIDASRALLIARVPDSKLQIKALAEAKRTDGLGAQVSVRALQVWLRQNVMLRLDQARFPVASSTLCPDAGRCSDCPKRTGANPDLFAEVDSADICTDPPCYQRKEAAHRAEQTARAEAKGLRYVDGKEAQAIITPYSSGLRGYTRLDQKREDIDPQGPTLRQLLGKNAPSPVAIEHPRTGELIEAVPTEQAEAALTTLGLLKPTQTSTARAIEDRIAHLRGQLTHQVDKQARTAMWQALTTAVRALPDEQCATLLSPALLRHWLLEAILGTDHELMATLLGRQLSDDDQDQEQTLRLAIQAASHADICRATALWMAYDDTHTEEWYHRPNTQEELSLFKALAEVTGTDLQALHAATKKSLKAKTEREVAELRAKLKQATDGAAPSQPQDSAAQAQTREKRNTPLARAGKAKAAPAKPKLSAQEAERGIAAAMQSMESTPSYGGVQAFAIGTQVRITSKASQPKQKKFVGKCGSVVAIIGPEARDVKLRGRAGELRDGICGFHTSELEVIE